ncbi:MAG TPA: hypothetical protein VKT72_04525 [Candidatus Baltobacteraceae bacterium]|nr:hypothetical protein [Candidatus Baltobacteraceae bacterium]
MNLLRALALFGALGFSLFAAGCSGSGSTTPPVMPQDGNAAPLMSAPSPATTAGLVHAMTSSSSLVGKIVYATYYSTAHEFQIETSSGFYWVQALPTTQWSYNGLTVRVGVWATASGSWKTSTTLDASSISLSTSSAPTGSAPTHVQTAEYLTSSTEMRTSPAVYAPYLSWAYPIYSRSGLTRAYGIKTVLYTSPIMPDRSTYEYDTLEGSYPSGRATTCSGGLVTTYNGAGLLSDPTKSTTTAYFGNVVNHTISMVEESNPGYSHPWDLIYIDNDGPLYGASSTPCNYNPITWGSAQDAALAVTGQKFILNSLSVADDNVPTFVQRLGGSAIEGGEFEECFMTALWSSEEDAQLQAVALLKREGKAGGAGFWCYADNTSALGASSIGERMYIYASFLLTYDPNYSVFEESFTTSPSTFKVFPETGFVPLSPVITPTASSSLETSTGAYLREYNSCYYRGSYVGKCEVIVNPSTTSYVSVPNPWGLHHAMSLSGGGVLDGGYASFAGAAPTSMAPKSGLILTP